MIELVDYGIRGGLKKKRGFLCNLMDASRPSDQSIQIRTDTLLAPSPWCGSRKCHTFLSAIMRLSPNLALR